MEDDEVPVPEKSSSIKESSETNQDLLFDDTPPSIERDDSSQSDLGDLKIDEELEEDEIRSNEEDLLVELPSINKIPSHSSEDDLSQPLLVLARTQPSVVIDQPFKRFHGSPSKSQKIVKAYRKRAYKSYQQLLQSKALAKRIQSKKNEEIKISDDSEDEKKEETAAFNKLDDKLEKCGTTLKKVKVAAKKDEVPMDIELEPPLLVKSLPDTQPKQIFIKDIAKLVETTPKVVPAVPDTKIRSAMPFGPVKLQRSKDGMYQIVNPVKILPPESFPKAIQYSQYEKQREMMKKIQASQPQPSTSKAAMKESRKISESDYDDLICIVDNLKPSATHKKPAPVSIPPARPPQTIKSIIPQDLLFSSTDKIKEIDSFEIVDSPESVEPPKDDELFVILTKEDENRATTPPATAATTSRKRRKSVLIPKVDEEPLFEMPPRPQTNVDLIENLAKYRHIVQSLLGKLKMPEMDFNEDSNEYINMYKIYRN